VSTGANEKKTLVRPTQLKSDVNRHTLKLILVEKTPILMENFLNKTVFWY
tara:strand:+ start:91 stop:240 length:150 start_codon:yes stop_codon:yes gene_type:complete